ncbi:MAG: MATE family efflux transporter, partial [Bacillota bacterium]
MRKGMVDFTTGSIPRHLIMFAIPMFLGNLLQALYNTVDSIWVGRFLGHRALAAVSVSGPITFALIAMVMGLTMATTTMVAQYYGAQQQHMVRKTVTNSLVLLTVLGVLFSLVGYFLRIPILNLVNAPADIMSDAAGYLGIYSLGLIGMFWYNAAGAIMRGLGDSRTPLRYLAYATVANIILDPLLIFGYGPIPKMGVAGAALATIIAQGGSAVLALVHLERVADLMHLEGDFWKLDGHLTAQTFKIGLPAGLQQTLVSLSGMVVSSIVNGFGSVAVAGFGAGQRIDQFSFMPSMSVGLAVSALVGQNMGAGKD